ncbi:DUF397 domain-containing protein [Kitasatospora sp. NPDC059803]|uniref:DUF397 domain-containing protein n=1 Tax=Kitasatospora sp. NPDC059803 TaxID=3346953 RepID=UPI00364FA19B
MKLLWHKSSYSGGNGGNCVEVAHGHPDLVSVRDSKDASGPVLSFPDPAWGAFVAAVQNGEFPV